MKKTLFSFVFLLACGSDPDDTGIPAEPPILYVSSYFAGMVHRYDPATGETLSPIIGVEGAQTVTLHEGRLVIVAEQANAVLLADPGTGEVIDSLIADDPSTEIDETGGLEGPTAAVLGPDNRWYVASFNNSSVLRYDLEGNFVDVFISEGSDGLEGPDIGMTFNAEEHLLVPGYYSNAVHVFGVDGVPKDRLLDNEDGLRQPRAVLVGEDGRTWVSSRGSNAVLIRTSDGNISEITNIKRPSGLCLYEGELLVASEFSNTVTAYDAETYESLGDRISDEAIDGITHIGVL